MNDCEREAQFHSVPLKAWVRPAARRLDAGAAEFQQTNATDNFTAAS
jgi:hypothetical protein